MQCQDIELRARLDELLDAGRCVEATSPECDVSKLPDYFDEERFARAQAVIKRWYTNISIASSSGLILLLQIECILRPLLKTKKSRTCSALFDRYVDTTVHLRRWYETRFYEPGTEGWKSLMLVRAMHQRIHKLMNSRAEEANSADARQLARMDEQHRWVNQYDMALTQFAFVGLFILHPERCAIYDLCEEKLSDVAYYWRLISYFLGIEERFNLFVYHDDLSKQVAYMKLIYENQVEVMGNPRSQVGIRMAEAFTLAFEDLTSESSFNILDHWWAGAGVSLSGRQVLLPYSWADLYKLTFFKLYFCVLFRIDFLASLINEKYKKKFDKFAVSGDTIRPKLDRKYKDFVFE